MKKEYRVVVVGWGTVHSKKTKNLSTQEQPTPLPPL
jgi:hypothetical protein